jgi:prepilin-type N-terminal cleavage/methylation domain-containing protein
MRSVPSQSPPPIPHNGFSLVEVMIVLTMIGILTALAVPGYRRAMEQSRADIAGANLRAIWSAQRLYWIEFRTYAADVAPLQAAGLLDPLLVASAEPYGYAVQSADSNTFTAVAIRSGSGLWNGQFTIDESGQISGGVQARGQPQLTPGFL